MATDTSLVEKLDALVADILADWNIYTTIVAGIVVTFGLYSLISSKDPDVHPFLLARQSTASPIRQQGESATYRCLETPHGLPLRFGLNVKDPGAPKWTGGRRGDLRDIWKTAMRGALNEDGTMSKKQGKIYTVLGRKAIEHSLDQVTQEINVIGHHLHKSGVKTVAVCLTDSIELLATIFAGAFYGYKTVIVPHNLPAETLSAHLQHANADVLIAEAGSLDLSLIAKANDQLSLVLWVAKYGNRHMDWNAVPEDAKDSLKVAVWHELVEEFKELASCDVPQYDPKTETPAVITVWPSSSQSGKFIDFQPENLVSAIGAIISSIPRTQSFNPSDIVLSIDSLSRSYPLCTTLAALFANSSIALNSVAGENVDFALATAGVSPTVIVASSQTMAEYHDNIMRPHTGIISSLGRWLQARTLDAGNMPTRNFFSQLARVSPTSELSLDEVRLLCISHRIDGNPAAQLTSEQLTELRIFTGARVVYALTGPGVAGAIAQTNAFDYRCLTGPSHFGAPLSSTEITLTNVPEGSPDDTVEGQLTVSGPAVVGGTVTLPCRARISKDNTLELCS
ncbi:AMP-dependent synthetase/ligase [Penicillium coprophilum]|uniref:AMP-dependent synthetase/ligase n=1 Tax=Penicillium coprophilum TaxID=36646 RepID=UPI002387329B|nr:AMP-dependent synthetase/ligase [Penicillium coprophilum]KAJ5164994.1 AMP-dependent synthetase/ligase [Penicillium coprophilum]